MADIAEASRASSLELQKQLGEYKEKNRRELAEMQTQLKEKSLEVEKARLAASRMQDEVMLPGISLSLRRGSFTWLCKVRRPGRGGLGKLWGLFWSLFLSD